jgi:hypothetical protein
MVDINLKLDTEKITEIQQNQDILKSIVQTIIFIGRQGVAMRDLRNAGLIALQALKNITIETSDLCYDFEWILAIIL